MFFDKKGDEGHFSVYFWSKMVQILMKTTLDVFRDTAKVENCYKYKLVLSLSLANIKIIFKFVYRGMTITS